MQKFEIKDHGFVRREFNRLFNIDFAHYQDREMLFQTKNITIDIFKFDQYLTEKYHYQESLKDFILNQFGKEALEFIEKLI